jgi:hypothetical protein
VNTRCKGDDDDDDYSNNNDNNNNNNLFLLRKRVTPSVKAETFNKLETEIKCIYIYYIGHQILYCMLYVMFEIYVCCSTLNG